MEHKKVILGLSIFVTIVVFSILMLTLRNFGVMTGHATATGEANLTIQTAASISFNISQVNWGTGYVNETEPSATLDTEGAMNGTDWDSVNSGLVVQNDGNVNVSLNLTSSKNADDFIGGTDPSFKWRASENETDSCPGTLSVTSYTSATTSHQNLCDNMGYIDTKDTIEIDLEVVVPQDALGTKGVVITAHGTAVA